MIFTVSNKKKKFRKGLQTDKHVQLKKSVKRS